MATFIKLTQSDLSSYHCKHKDKHLMVIPQIDNPNKGELSIGVYNDDFYKDFLEDRQEEEISETEFLTIVGNITGAIKNFMDLINID